MNEAKTVFSDIFAVFDYLKSKGWTIPWGFHRYFEVMQYDDDEVYGVPMPMNPLYRGQNTFYQESYPSLYRRKRSEEEILEIELQVEELKLILQDNPEIKDHISGGLKINYTGLAQHYGIPTNLFDLTNSPIVAAFFATTEYDYLKDEYHPVLSMVNKGVLYFWPHGGIELTNARKPSIMPVGMEALPRPGEQAAYSIELKEGENLNHRVPIAFEFWHNPKASIQIFEQCGRGKALFPYDPMANKIRMIQMTRTYSEQSLKTLCSRLNRNIERTRTLLEKSGCYFTERCIFRYTSAELRFITERYHKKYSDSFPKSNQA